MTTIKCIVFVALTFAAVVGASGNKVQQLEKETFSSESKMFHGSKVAAKIEEMIAALEAGEGSASREELSLDSLKSLVADCTYTPSCDFETDLAKLKRVSERRVTDSHNMQTYLDDCKYSIYVRCDQEIHKLASEKFSSLDKQTLETVQALANQRSEDSYFREYDSPPFLHTRPYQISILRVLMASDPNGLKKVAKNEAKLRQFLDEKIRQPCVAYLDHVDPLVRLSPTVYIVKEKNAFSDLSLWKESARVCEKILNIWEPVVAATVKHCSYDKW